jgi:hypothetical protein
LGKRKTSDKIKIDLTLSIMDYFVRYMFSANGNITKRSLIKVRELFEVIDESQYEDDREMEVRIYLTKKLLEGRLDKKINDIEMLSTYALGGGQYDSEIEDIYDELMADDFDFELDNDQVVFIDEYVTDRLKYAYVFRHEGDLDSKMMKLRARDFSSLSEFNEEFETTIEAVYKDMKKVRSESKYAARDFDSGGDSLKIALGQTIENLNKESNIIKTGIKILNQMLNGGFHASRVYMFLGMAKGWKSGFLLNCCLWGLKHNPNIVTVDKTKTPCILYLTQENSVDETLERIWSHYFGDNDELKNYSEEEAYEKLSAAGFNQGNIHLKVKYRPNKSISTADMDAMIDEIEVEDNYEVIMIVQDYVKRIRSIYKHTDLRLELGSVVDEFTVIAKDRQIPIVTASQLNRDAFRVAEASAGKKANLAKQLGASNAGESMLMIENVDAAYILAKEMRESTGNEYLTVKNIASRGKSNSLTYFAHPFEEGYGMKLVEDIGMAKSASVFDLADDLANFDPTGKNSGKTRNDPTPSRRIPRVRTSKPESEGEASNQDKLDQIMGIMD